MPAVILEAVFGKEYSDRHFLVLAVSQKSDVAPLAPPSLQSPLSSRMKKPASEAAPVCS
jgi:hypothetical protein